ncbi:DUF2127 domain-containing protein [Methylophaga sulfidovorans]|uniref:Uncharacterized membrane protein, DUF2068 family n=1 Tax=Methylophaga sulfidovorans TaxID=45496 RepID=A0A1I3Z7K3_9GAMM|nr:DUF2127 domain-containing protein [Methylophaga sulfidovorans]SFK39997.1 Uncharacterized membrane protein, DUF2068 family [Methylophaga sulfidovorans]
MNTSQTGLRLIAIMEASKGGLALLISLGLHALMGHNIEQLAEKLFSHLHLNPASHYPNIVLLALADINNTKLMIVAIAALLYSLLRFVEAYGLWHKYRWTEWLALVSSVVYLPFELYELYQKTDVLSVLLLVINTLVIIYLAAVLNKSKGI